MGDSGMTASVRGVLTGLAAAFALYLAVRSLVWTGGEVRAPTVMVLATAVYLAAVTVCLLAVRAPDSVSAVATRMPLGACVVALGVAAALPGTVSFAVAPEARSSTFGTWYIGAIGLLMAIVMVRRRAWFAWTGMALLTVAAMAWLGPGPALGLGLVGSLMWVLAAQLLVLSMDRAARDTARLAELQLTASAWRAAQLGRQRERRILVRRALAVSGPVLTRTIEQGGVLDGAERLEARIAEGRLRDELRGARLLDDRVRAQLLAARRRGAVVTVVDEGGLDGLDDRQLDQVRGELAETLRGASSDRLYIRASTDPRVAVTVVGRSGVSTSPSDEDDVDMWREIPRPPVAV